MNDPSTLNEKDTSRHILMKFQDTKEKNILKFSQRRRQKKRPPTKVPQSYWYQAFVTLVTLHARRQREWLLKLGGKMIFKLGSYAQPIR